MPQRVNASKRKWVIIKTVKYTGKKVLRKHEIKEYERNKTHIEMADTVIA